MEKHSTRSGLIFDRYIFAKQRLFGTCLWSVIDYVVIATFAVGLALMAAWA